MLKDLQAIEETGIKLVAVSYDSVETLKQFADDNQITYLLLSDEGSKTIHAYGVHNQEGYPHPGTYLIDQQEIVRAAIFLGGHITRHKNSALIEAAREMG